MPTSQETLTISLRHSIPGLDPIVFSDTWPPALQIPPEGVELSDLKVFVKSVLEDCLGSGGIGAFLDPFFDQLPALKGVCLTRLEVVPGENGGSAAFFVGFQLRDTWKIVSDPSLPDLPALAISNPGFTIGSPGGPDPSYRVDVYGTLEIFGVAISVMAQWPAMIITGTLARRLDLQALLAEAGFTGLAPAGEEGASPLPDIRSLLLRIDLGGGACDFTLGLGGWEILPGKLTLTNLLLDLKMRPDDTSAGLRTQFKVCDVDIDLAGQFQDGHVKFAGSTGPGQQIHIGGLVKDISRLFGAEPDLPAPLEDLVIQDLGVSFDTKNKDFKFTCTGGLPVSAKSSLAATLAIDVKHDDQGNCRFELGGQLDVLMDKTRLEFKLLFEYEAKAHRFTASYHHDGKLPLDVSALVCALAPGDPGLTGLIAGLDMEVDLKDAQLAFCKEVSKPPERTKASFGVYLLAEVSFAKPGSPDEQLTAKINSFLFSSFDRGAADQETTFLFGVKIGAEFSLSSLPLVSSQLPAGQDVGVKDLQLFAATRALLPDDLAQVSRLLDAPERPAPKKDPENKSEHILEAGVTVMATLRLGAESQDLIFAPSGESPAQAGSQEGGGSQPAGQGAKAENALVVSENKEQSARPSVKWIKVQKTFGPLRFDRLGFQFQNQVILFLLDASLSAGGLTISFEGLGFGSRIDRFEPQFNLEGMGISYKNDPVAISGAFLKNTEKPGVEEYSGYALIKAKSFTLSAIGSYAYVKDIGPSMFIFAYLDTPLGGPPCFYVTGLAAGFGYNSMVKIPDIEQVKDFPLLAAMVDPSKIGGANAKPMEVLAKLDTWITPQPGAFWLAAGISFKSFEIIKSNVLAIAQFGPEFQLLIVGFSTLRLPQEGSSIYAYAELMIRISVRPAEGFVSAMALLTPNSYLLDPACHLTGGFAFYLWFGDNVHAGDFVLTIGGYHPTFSPPAHYPQPQQVPRLGFNWPVSSNVTIKGEAYFALTPSCAMAGARLEVLYQSGNLKAWFIAQADVIIYWKPFYFEASIAVRIGVSYRIKIWFIRKTLSVELGAGVELWGPPTGGKVHINWWIISFTVSFGADKRIGPTAVDWDGFKKMLPPRNDADAGAIPGSTDPDLSVIQIQVNNGLLQQVDGKNGAGGKKGKQRWIVRPEEFTFSIETAVPLTKGLLGNVKEAPGANPETDGQTPIPTIGIRPMDIQSITTLQTVSIKQSGKLHGTWVYDRQTRSLPEAMWGPPIKGSLKAEAKLIHGCLVGARNFRLEQDAGSSESHPFATTYASIDLQEGETVHRDHLPLSAPAGATEQGNPISGESLPLIQETLGRADIAARRKAVLSVLDGLGMNGLTDGDLKTLAENPAASNKAAPRIGSPAPGR